MNYNKNDELYQKDKNDDQNNENMIVFDHFQSNSTKFLYKSNNFRYKWSRFKSNRSDE